MSERYDLLIVGGGINGAGIARDAAGRGLSVLVVEQADLAAATSSASTKLIHGGLRYLEYYEFRLVREALKEREVLLRAAPHIVRPQTFVLPHHRALRPQWMLRIGLFLYDHLGGREKLPGTRRLDLRTAPEGRALDPRFTTGFAYSDCWVDDARLVVLNARDAVERGAKVETRTRCTRLARSGELWRAELTAGGTSRTVEARAVVNAAGPWVTAVLDSCDGIRRTADLRLVKGSHIIVPRAFDGDHAYIFQNGDGRIAFAIPYQDDFTLIGTTDVPFDGDPARVAITPDEVRYLLDLVNGYLREPLTEADVVSSYSGVRPLYDDRNTSASAVTRDYVFDLDTAGGGAPLLSIFGGKITTYRKLAEHALQKLAPLLGVDGRPWTGDTPLTGGDVPGADMEAFLHGLTERYGWLPAPLLDRWAHAYGTRITEVIGDARSLDDLGAEVAPGLYEAELVHLRDREWARTAEDVLWRRSKLGLRYSEAEVAAVDAWFGVRTEGRIRA